MFRKIKQISIISVSCLLILYGIVIARSIYVYSPKSHSILLLCKLGTCYCFYLKSLHLIIIVVVAIVAVVVVVVIIIAWGKPAQVWHSLKSLLWRSQSYSPFPWSQLCLTRIHVDHCIHSVVSHHSFTCLRFWLGLLNITSSPFHITTSHELYPLLYKISHPERSVNWAIRANTGLTQPA